MMKTVQTVTILLASALLAFACSTSSSDPTPTSDAGTQPPGDEDASTSSSSSGGTGKDAGPATCGAAASRDACLECCGGVSPDGAAAYQIATLQCMCKEGNCLTECTATFCAEEAKSADATCNSCMTSKKGNCAAELTEKCSADPGCVAFKSCLDQAACDQKN